MSKTTKVIAGASWLPLVAALISLSQEGLVAIGLPVTVSWSLAIGLTLASSAFSALARARESLLFGGLALVTIATLSAFDYCNVADKLNKLHRAPAQVEEAVVDAENAQAAAVQAEVLNLENRLREARSKAEAERLGLVSGKAGGGPAWKLLVAQAEALEAELQAKRVTQTQAAATLSRAKREAAKVTAGQHLLAGVSPWVLFGGAVVLELVVAGLAWGMGEGVGCSQPTPQVINQVFGSSSPENLAENEPLSTELRQRANRISQRCRRAGY